MRNTLKKMRNTLKLKKKKNYLFYFQANKKKKAQKKFELKSEKKKKKKINRASPQKSPTSILNVKQTQSKKKKQPNRW